MLDWERIKSEVDLEQYFLFKQGSMFQFDKYKKAYVENAASKHGDIIRFFKHERTGVKMYYSIVCNDSGDIIQFIKKRILKKIDASASEINQELNYYLGNAPSKVFNRPIISKQNPQKPFINGDIFEINGNIIPNIDQHLEYLLNFRLLSREVLKSQLFGNVFFTYKTDNIYSLASYIHDINGNIVGLKRIQTADNEYHNKKWFEKNSNNGIGFTFSGYNINTETLSFFETIFDAISFQELFNMKSVQYMCSNGELGFRKAGLIREYFYKNNFKKLDLCNDNDNAGCYFNLAVVVAFISDYTSVKKSKSKIVIEMVATEEESTIKILRQFFKKLTSQKTKEDIDPSPQFYYTETLSQNRLLYFFNISNTQQDITFNLDLILRIWKLDKFITIKNPVKKDFNEDLIALKTQIK